MSSNHESATHDSHQTASENNTGKDEISEALRKQGAPTYCTGSTESTCACNSLDDNLQTSRKMSYIDRRNWVTVERLQELRKRVHEATKTHKTFTIRGCFYTVRKTLIERGWVEKLDVHRRVQSAGMMPIEEIAQHLPQRRPGESRRHHLIKCERNIMSRFLEHVPIDFLWSSRKEKTDWLDMARNPTLTINKLHKNPFTTKEGLCATLRDFHWFFEEGKSEMYFPRCYNVFKVEELDEFVEDFRLTSCMSLLRWLCEKQKQSGIQGICEPCGQVPVTTVQFAMQRCREYVNSRLHYDIDEDAQMIWDHDWEVLYTHHDLMVNEGAKLRDSKHNPVELLFPAIDALVDEMARYWPQYHLDGYFNVWIVKPANRCRGKGILLMNNVQKIKNLVSPETINKVRYVVQKYIERPLIIHNTKFDIRQWFLVTSVQPMIVWMYKECYCRFSSQEYNLTNYHESVHLTNHAVQKKYKNGKRDDRLPRENMWDGLTFQAYLRQIGHAEMWADRIYPGMQRAIIGTMLASQDNMDRRVNTFELFGADFMICENFFPWLIEINSSPDLGASTSVTASLCPQCLEDVIKVVIDRRADPKADTGGFEMIYRQIIPPAPAYMGLNLFLKGKQILPKTQVKKDKIRDIVKLNSSRSIYNSAKDSMEFKSTPLMMDIMECFTNRLEEVKSGRGIIRKSGLLVLKKPTNLKFSTEVTLRKDDSTQKRIIPNKRSIKPLDRRHTSCGPRLKVNDEDCSEHVEPNNNHKDFKCVGSKCCDKNVHHSLAAIKSLEKSKTSPILQVSRNSNVVKESCNGNNLLSVGRMELNRSPRQKNDGYLSDTSNLRKGRFNRLLASTLPITSVKTAKALNKIQNK